MTRCFVTAVAFVLTVSVTSRIASATVVAQYSFENNLSDSAAGGSDSDTLSYVQGVSGSATAQYVAGVVGQAGLFDGNYFTAVDSGDLSLNDNTWTIEAFIHVSAHNATWERLVLKWGGSNDYHFALNSQDFDFFDSSATNVVDNVNTTPDTDFTDGWHHVALTSSAAGSEAWIDGVSVFTGGAITLADGTDPLALGDSAIGAGVGFRFNGWMDEVRIHDMAVSQDYIDSRAALLLPPPAPEPSTAVLAVLAITGLGFTRRRRRV